MHDMSETSSMRAALAELVAISTITMPFVAINALDHRWHRAVATARAALAQRADEPVAPAYVPLSDDEIKTAWWQCEFKMRDADPRHVWWEQFARAIEALVVARTRGEGK
jgi:hypothetical protein